MSLSILVASDQWQEFDNAWNVVMAGEGPIDDLLVALRLAGEKRRIARCMPLVREHVELLLAGERYEDAARLMGAALLAGGASSELGASLREVAEQAYGQEPLWPAHSEISGLADPGSDLRQAWRSFDRLRAFQPGSLVYHPGGWGTGEILGVDVEGRTITVRFQSGRRDDFPMSAAIDIFDPLPESDLRARYFRDPEATRETIKKQPLDVLRAVLERYHGRATLAAIKNALAQVGIEGSSWSAWWRKAKKAAEANEWFRITGSGQRSEVRLLLEASDPAQELGRRLHTLDSLAEVLPQASDAIAADGDERLAEVAVQALREGASDESEAPEHRFAAWLLVRERTGETPHELVELMRDALAQRDEGSPTGGTPALWRLFSGLRTAKEHERALPVLQEVLGEDWADEAVRSFDHVPPAMVRPLIDALLAAGREADLAELYRKLLRRPLRAPHALVGLARVAETGKLRGDWPPPIARAQSLVTLAAHLWSDRRADAAAGRVHSRLVDLLTGGSEPLLERLIKDADEESMRSLQLLVQRGVDDSIENLVIVHASRAGLHLGGDHAPFWESDTIWTTKAGLERHAAELKHLKEVKVPENERAINRAAGMGDISENAEWEMAIQEQRNLSERIRDLEADLRKAQLLENASLPEDTVAPGTTVRFRTLPDGQEQTLTLLGPWDVHESDDVISYRAPLAQGLLGLHSGEQARIELPGGEIEIEILEIRIAPID